MVSQVILVVSPQNKSFWVVRFREMRIIEVAGDSQMVEKKSFCIVFRLVLREEKS